MRPLLVALLFLAACDLPTEPEIPENAVPMDPVPTIYDRWWLDVMRDSGIQRDVSRVHWFVVPGGLFWSEREQRESAGRWIPDGRIYIAEGWMLWENAVKHEMLHEILRGDHEHKHPLFAHYNSCQRDGLPTSCDPNF